MKGAKSKDGASTKADGRLTVKKRGAKKAKDPNKPKRPPSAFFVFMEGFRKQFKEQNPSNKLVSVVSKAGGDKWKSMSDSDKADYVAKAEKLKAEYLKTLKAYDQGLLKNKDDGEGSDKSKSEVNDEEGEGSGSEVERESDNKM